MPEDEIPEETKPEGKKKKGKLPIIIALCVILGGGGFFGMKMKAGPAKKPVLKLSKEKSVDLKEFLVNLRDHGMYCRAEFSLGLADGVEPKLIEDRTGAIRDVINMRLSSKSLSQLQPLDGLRELKRQIAADVNKVLAEDVKPAEAPAPVATKGPVGPKAAKDSGKPVPPEHPDWDSQTGPVLKVYFNSFATQ